MLDSNLLLTAAAKTQNTTNFVNKIHFSLNY